MFDIARERSTGRFFFFFSQEREARDASFSFFKCRRACCCMDIGTGGGRKLSLFHPKRKMQREKLCVFLFSYYCRCPCCFVIS